jgi:hypothetical protein
MSHNLLLFFKSLSKAFYHFLHLHFTTEAQTFWNPKAFGCVLKALSISIVMIPRHGENRALLSSFPTAL